jgi:hypothetical protein
MDQPATYQIRIQGQLDESWSEWRGGLAISSEIPGETLMIGQITDQAALHGILDKLYAMNLSLIAFSRVDTVRDSSSQELSEK